MIQGCGFALSPMWNYFGWTEGLHHLERDTIGMFCSHMNPLFLWSQWWWFKIHTQPHGSMDFVLFYRKSWVTQIYVLGTMKSWTHLLHRQTVISPRKKSLELVLIQHSTNIKWNFIMTNLKHVCLKIEEQHNCSWWNLWWKNGFLWIEKMVKKIELNHWQLNLLMISILFFLFLLPCYWILNLLCSRTILRALNYDMNRMIHTLSLSHSYSLVNYKI